MLCPVIFKQLFLFPMTHERRCLNSRLTQDWIFLQLCVVMREGRGIHLFIWAVFNDCCYELHRGLECWKEPAEMNE